MAFDPDCGAGGGSCAVVTRPVGAGRLEKRGPCGRVTPAEETCGFPRDPSQLCCGQWRRAACRACGGGGARFKAERYVN